LDRPLLNIVLCPGASHWVSGFIAKEPARLSDKFIQQISHQLEQRCRDVEF
jgi:hypothetical protein